MTSDQVQRTKEEIIEAKRILGLEEGEKLVKEKRKRIVWDNDMIEWTLRAFGQAKTDDKYDAIKLSGWKPRNKRGLIQEDLNAIREQHPLHLEYRLS